MNTFQNTTLSSTIRGSQTIRYVRKNDNIGKTHQRLYTNIQLLTLIYPPSKQFNEVFKSDMFLKNNKAAFHQVVYYLLDVLNPELTKKNITTWPIFEIRQESKFRTEVLTYLNSLKSIYSDIEIPSIMASHLISPGGIKFVKFMLKLSLLVVHEVLKRNEDVVFLLTPVKTTKNPTINKIVRNNLKQKTSQYELATTQLIQEFDEESEIVRQSVVKITEENEEFYSELQKTKKIYNEKLALLNEPFDSVVDGFNKKLDKIESDIKEIDVTANICNESSEIVDNLLNNKLGLEFNKETTQLPNEVKQMVKIRNDCIDLAQFFKAATIYLRDQSFDLPNYLPSQLDSFLSISNELNQQYSEVVEQLEETNEKQIAVGSKLQKRLYLNSLK